MSTESNYASVSEIMSLSRIVIIRPTLALRCQQLRLNSGGGEQLREHTASSCIVKIPKNFLRTSREERSSFTSSSRRFCTQSVGQSSQANLQQLKNLAAEMCELPSYVASRYID